MSTPKTESQRLARDKWLSENRERVNASRRKWALANPEKTREMHKRWSDKNKDKVSVINKRSREKAKEAGTIQISKKAYYDNNRESILIKKREYNERTRDARIIYLRDEYSKPVVRFKRLINGAIDRSKKLGRSFDKKAMEESVKIPPTECQCCGAKFDFEAGEGKKSLSPSIDRIDNDLGYVSGNIGWVCTGCNSRKGDMLLHQIMNVLIYILMAGRAR